MKCPYCKESIKTGSMKCKHYHADLTTEESKKLISEQNKMSPLVKFGGGFLIILFVVGVIASGGNVPTSSTSTITSPQSSVNTVEVPKENTWEYENKTEKLSGKPMYLAKIESNELLYFKFPYEGSQPLTLVLRHNSDKSNDVILSIEKGQFTGTYNNETVSVRFDDGPVEKLSFSGPSDSSTDTIFINNAEYFLKKLRNAKKLIISATFYNEGDHTSTFNVSGVKF